MRIDICISALPKGTNDLQTWAEEQNLKQDISNLLITKGYTKYIIAGSEMIRDEIKDNLNKRCLNDN